LPEYNNGHEYSPSTTTYELPTDRVQEHRRCCKAILLPNQECNPDNVCPLNRNPLQCGGRRTTISWYRHAPRPWTREAYSSTYQLFHPGTRPRFQLRRGLRRQLHWQCRFCR